MYSQFDLSKTGSFINNTDMKGEYRQPSFGPPIQKSCYPCASSGVPYNKLNIGHRYNSINQ